jgi:hypothetical protein
MLFDSSLILAQVETQFPAPGYFQLVMLALFALGAIGWLVAAVLGFARAPAFGPAARWFALAAVCLLLYHIQFVLTVLVGSSNPEIFLAVGAFFNLFIVLGAGCGIMGFVRMTSPR